MDFNILERTTKISQQTLPGEKVVENYVYFLRQESNFLLLRDFMNMALGWAHNTTVYVVDTGQTLWNEAFNNISSSLHFGCADGLRQFWDLREEFNRKMQFEFHVYCCQLNDEDSRKLAVWVFKKMNFKRSVKDFFQWKHRVIIYKIHERNFFNENKATKC